MKIFLFGEHARRTPLAYEPYRAILPKGVSVVSDPRLADCVVAGFDKDLRDNSSLLTGDSKIPKGVPIFVVSEEPLWESVWAHDPNSAYVDLDCGLRYRQLGYFSSNLFRFSKLPYYITTDDAFLSRYIQLFAYWLRKSPSELYKVWSAASFHASFFVENRIDHRYDVFDDHGDLIGLSCFRSRLAASLTTFRVQIAGSGWHTEAPRQALVDWHLDKLTRCQGTFLQGSIENTYHQDYLTEKIFDAYACGAVPIVWGPKASRVWEFASADASVNVAGMPESVAAQCILDYEPTLAAAESYLECLNTVLKTRLNSDVLWAERRGLLTRLLAELENF